MFPLKFHKHKESFYEMKKEGENSNGFNVHFNLRLFHNFPPYSLSVLKKQLFLVLLAFSNSKMPFKVLTRPVAQYLHTSSLLWKPT